MAIRIGCSGFLYEHWRHRFYEAGDRGSELEAYVRSFDTVELNVTFYRMPSAATFRSWASRVPEDFIFAVKASRYLTHVRRLREPRDPVDYLMERVSELGKHLGPILLQLPPDLPVDLERLVETLDAFPRTARIAFEPRHPSWFVDEVRRALEQRNAALCVADRRGPITPLWQTADWGYVRFHGGRAKPRSCYDERDLERWSERLHDSWGDRDGFAYFNNDFNGCALRDAARFGRALAERGFTVSKMPVVPYDVVVAAAPRG